MTLLRSLILICAGLALTAGPARALDLETATWSDIVAEARGQTVYWNAWAGHEGTNAFIAWAGEQVQARYGVAIRHVRLRSTSEAVARVVAEKAAGRNSGGSVDLIWINGPNFLQMKEQGLHFGPFTHRLPNYRYVDETGKPSTVIDFTVLVEGYAAPWRMAQVAFVYDSAGVEAPPHSMKAMVAWAERYPGRLTHPHVRNFLGATFFKQALYEFVPDPALLLQPVDPASVEAVTQPLWDWYEALKPNLWRGGTQFPDTGPAQDQLMMDGELALFITFLPSHARTAIADGRLPPSVRVTGLDGGTIGNTSFVSIPYNAAHKAGALVVANFLLSPEAQAHGQDYRSMGNPTVLDVDALPPEQRRFFDDLPEDDITPSQADLGVPLLEPHPSWMTHLTAAWEARYER